MDIYFSWVGFTDYRVAEGVGTDRDGEGPEEVGHALSLSALGSGVKLGLGVYETGRGKTYLHKSCQPSTSITMAKVSSSQYLSSAARSSLRSTSDISVNCMRA